MKKIFLNIVKLLLPLFLFFGCASGALNKKNVFNNRYASYGIEFDDPKWEKKSFRGTDLFFEHKESKAQIYLTSQCKQFSDSPLEALTAQLLVGLSDIEYESQEMISMDKRGALLSEISGKIDGVKRFLRVAVLRKNRCVFDAVLSMPQKNEEAKNDFDLMIQSFWAEVEL